MGQFKFQIAAIGSNGCDRRAAPGEKLHARCGKFTCPDCMAYDFVQTLKQKGIAVGEATFTHYPGTKIEVVDDLVKNERRSGQL
jgi:hypothetical protein